MTIEWLKKNAMFSCQNKCCAEEVSFHEDELRLYKALPICYECYDNDTPICVKCGYAPCKDMEEHEGHWYNWSDLAPFDPFQGLVEA